MPDTDRVRRRRGIWAWGTILALVAIGCAPDVHVKPAAAGVEEFRDRTDHSDREACSMTPLSSAPIKMAKLET